MRRLNVTGVAIMESLVPLPEHTARDKGRIEQGEQIHPVNRYNRRNEANPQLLAVKAS